MRLNPPSLAAGMLLLSLAACDRTPEASKEEFTRVLNAKLAERPPCIPTEGFPRQVTESGYTRFYSPSGRHLEALMDAGLIQIENETTTKGPGDLLTRERTYGLTQAGRSVYRTDVRGPTGDIHPGFCFGVPELAEVTSYTEPADAMGYRVSYVSYTYRMTELPEWVRRPGIREAYPLALGPALQAEKEPQRGKMTLVLTGEGWIPEHEALAR